MEVEEEKNKVGLETGIELIDILINLLIHSSHRYLEYYVPGIAVDSGDSNKREE